jgi:hypothetical protein
MKLALAVHTTGYYDRPPETLVCDWGCTLEGQSICFYRHTELEMFEICGVLTDNAALPFKSEREFKVKWWAPSD